MNYNVTKIMKNRPFKEGIDFCQACENLMHTFFIQRLGFA